MKSPKDLSSIKKWLSMCLKGLEIIFAMNLEIALGTNNFLNDALQLKIADIVRQ